MTYTVELSHAANPDVQGGYWSRMSRPKGRQLAQADSLREASKVCRTYIDAYDLGGGNWTGGRIYLNGLWVGRVSYNGRVWDLDGREILLDAPPPDGELIARAAYDGGLILMQRMEG